MQQLILILHVLVAIAIIALVLMQHGRGADVGASFGSGSSNTMFGSTGAMPFLMKVTVICTAIFFLTSISLSYIATRESKQSQTIMMPAVPSNAAQPSTNTSTGKANNNEESGFSFAPSAKK